MDDQIERRVRERCFRGHPVPRSLARLWNADPDVRTELFRITNLLADMEPVDATYGADLVADGAEGSWLRAYRIVFEDLAFFAELDGGELLAYWLRSQAPEPPIVRLDTEGLLSFLGVDLREGLVRLAEDAGTLDEATTWAAEVGLALGDVLEVGVTTQFLPDLELLHASIAAKLAGREDPEPARAGNAIDAGDASTWMLQRGAEVGRVVERVLGGPPREQLAWTTGGGLVKNLAFEGDVLSRVAVLGVAAPTSRVAVEAALGSPDRSGDAFVSYVRGRVRHNFRFDEAGALEEINLAYEPPGA